MLRPDAHDHLPAVVGLKRVRIGGAHRQFQAGGFDTVAGSRAR